jgi:hypothetical protein
MHLSGRGEWWSIKETAEECRRDITTISKAIKRFNIPRKLEPPRGRHWGKKWIYAIHIQYVLFLRRHFRKL